MDRYYVSKENFNKTQLQMRNVKESTNIKMKHASMKACLKTYAKFLKEIKGCNHDITLKEIQNLCRASNNQGISLFKLTNEMTSFLYELYFKNDPQLDLHRNTVMEILEEVSPEELPEEMQEDAKEIIEEVNKSNVKEIETSIKYNSENNEMEINVEKDDDERDYQEEMDELSEQDPEINEQQLMKKIENLNLVASKEGFNIFEKMFGVDDISIVTKILSNVNLTDSEIKDLNIEIYPIGTYKKINDAFSSDKINDVITKFKKANKNSSKDIENFTNELRKVVNDITNQIEKCKNIKKVKLVKSDVSKLITECKQIETAINNASEFTTKIKSQTKTDYNKTLDKIHHGAGAVYGGISLASGIKSLATLGIALTPAVLLILIFSAAIGAIVRHLIIAAINSIFKDMTISQRRSISSIISDLFDTAKDAKNILKEVSLSYVHAAHRIGKFKKSNESFTTHSELQLSQTLGNYYSKLCIDTIKAKLDPEFIKIYNR